MSAPIAPERVLPTLNADGTRYRVRPRRYDGRFLRWRRPVAWGLMLLFVALPFLRLHGKPVILLNVPERQFVLLGRVFLPTDGMLLMILMLTIFVGIMLVTALAGRAWCGWGCPQTVYMEFLFRPIEELFEGKREALMRADRSSGMTSRRAAKYGVFAVLSALLGNVFLSYFVGTDALRTWMSRSPFEHPTPFLIMAVTAGLVFADFAYFREQMCTVACPYARVQSVLLDAQSLIVGYDLRRGEPRGKGKPKPGDGDCIDCGACVAACPTGIDIRQGLQLECIACAQCIDACDSIMAKVEKPPGLIRYGAQTTLEQGLPGKILRPRVFAYAAFFALLFGLLTYFGQREVRAEVTVLRGIGAPFVLQSSQVENQIRIKIRNRSETAQHYRIELMNPGPARLIAPENPLPIAAGAQRQTSVFVLAPPAWFSKGQRPITFRILDERGFEQLVPYKLLGPQAQPGVLP